MHKKTMIGQGVSRKESLDKVSGQVRYANDLYAPHILHTAFKHAPHAYARILKIDSSKALEMPGIKAVLLGRDFPDNLGLYLCDKPPIAREVVRHYGEVVAVVIADTRFQAESALRAIDVTYEVLEPVLSPKEALKDQASMIHPEMAGYAHIPPIHPEPGTNIANRTRIRKGDFQKAFNEAAHVISNSVVIPLGDHVAMEPRVAIAEIKATGDIHITSSTQAPFVVKGLMSAFFEIDPGKITVTAPLLGGGFGGKAGIQLEALAYLASRAVGGRPVKVVNTREADLLSSPGHIGLEADVQIAADERGRFLGMDLTYYFNSGAYADYAVNVSRAAAISCTGPYHVPTVRCDSLCVYTNMPFATAYRGFGHIEMAYAIERAIDELAKHLQMDPLALRTLNAIKQGDLTPVQSVMHLGTGDLVKCFEVVAQSLGGNIGDLTVTDHHTVRAKGIAGLWKAPAMPTNTDAGAILTFNQDGSCNLNTGIVEMGQGTKTGLAQIVAEYLDLPLEKVHVVMDVNTRLSPSDWATAASRGLFMAGLATMEACEDAMAQIKKTASEVLRVPAHDLVVAGERVYDKSQPTCGLSLSEVVMGYVYPNGNAIVGQVIGRGKYIAKNLTDIDQETGKGHPDLEWTLGAEGVEIEVNPLTGHYKVLKAVCCIDVGKVINPFLARGQIVGGMAMGLGYTTKEGFVFNARGQVTNGSLRDYKIMRISEAPLYEVHFLETAQPDGPYGARGLGEQSVIGMPGAISNALSRAIGHALNQIPITPERVWQTLQEGKDDSV